MGIKRRKIINVKGQMKIQQMAFMIMAVFIFFVLVGLFFLNWQMRNYRGDVFDLNRERAISSLEVIASMSELSCGFGKSLCIDEDKVRVLSGNFGDQYKQLWPVESIEIYKIYPSFDQVIDCPAVGCNHYIIYESPQTNKTEFSTYVSLCKKVRQEGYVYENCEIAKLVVGMTLNE